MKIIKTKFFTDQVTDLEKKFKLIKNDLDNLENNLSFEPFSNLGL